MSAWQDFKAKYFFHGSYAQLSVEEEMKRVRGYAEQITSRRYFFGKGRLTPMKVIQSDDINFNVILQLQKFGNYYQYKVVSESFNGNTRLVDS